MLIRHTATRSLSRWGLLWALIGVMVSPSLAAASSSAPSPTITECEQWTQRPQGTGSGDNPCSSRWAFRAEEEVNDLSHEEEKGGFRWHLLEPDEHDLRLRYYPGAPRPLWGY